MEQNNRTEFIRDMRRTTTIGIVGIVACIATALATPDSKYENIDVKALAIPMIIGLSLLPMERCLYHYCNGKYDR
jgi:hypothetical protein